MTNEDRVRRTAEILKPEWVNSPLGSKVRQIEGALKYARHFKGHKKQPIKINTRGKPT